MSCELLVHCPFYHDKMRMEHGIGAIFKKKYCREGKDLCARYMVASALGPEHVSASLYPNMVDLAKRMIREANSSLRRKGQ